MGIRLEPEDRKLLEDLAVAWHLNAADIVRMAIKSLLDEAKHGNGKIELPFKIKPEKRRKAADAKPPRRKKA